MLILLRLKSNMTPLYFSNHMHAFILSLQFSHSQKFYEEDQEWCINRHLKMQYESLHLIPYLVWYFTSMIKDNFPEIGIMLCVTA